MYNTNIRNELETAVGAEQHYGFLVHTEDTTGLFEDIKARAENHHWSNSQILRVQYTQIPTENKGLTPIHSVSTSIRIRRVGEIGSVYREPTEYELSTSVYFSDKASQASMERIYFDLIKEGDIPHFLKIPWMRSTMRITDNTGSIVSYLGKVKKGGIETLTLDTKEQKEGARRFNPIQLTNPNDFHVVVQNHTDILQTILNTVHDGMLPTVEIPIC